MLCEMDKIVRDPASNVAWGPGMCLKPFPEDPWGVEVPSGPQKTGIPPGAEKRHLRKGTDRLMMC